MVAGEELGVCEVGLGVNLAEIRRPLIFSNPGPSPPFRESKGKQVE